MKGEWEVYPAGCLVWNAQGDLVPYVSVTLTQIRSWSSNTGRAFVIAPAGLRGLGAVRPCFASRVFSPDPGKGR